VLPVVREPDALGQQLVKEVMGPDPAGILMIVAVQLTPDTRSYVYSYMRSLSELYVVDGLKRGELPRL